MAKNTIQENVIETMFEVDTSSEKNATDKVTKFLSSLGGALMKANQQQLLAVNTTNANIQKIANNFAGGSNKIINALNKLQQKTKQVNSQKITGSLWNTPKLGEAFSMFDGLSDRIERFARRITFMSIGFVAAVERMTKAQRDLYYTAERLSLPIEDIERYKYIIGQLGGDSKTAVESLSKFNRTLQDMALGKNTEGLEVFGRLGLTTYDSSGNIKSVTSAFGELATAIKKLPTTQQQVHYLRKLGFDETEFNYFIKETQQLGDEFDSLYSTLLKGGNKETFLQRVATQSVKLYNTFLKLRTTASIMMKQFLDTISNKAVKVLANFNKMIINDADKILNSMRVLANIGMTVLDVLVNILNKVVQVTSSFYDWFNSLDETQQKVVKLTGVLAAFFKVMGVSVLKSPFGRVIAGLSLLLLMFEDYQYYLKSKDDNTFKYALPWEQYETQLDSLKQKFDSFKDIFSNENIQKFLVNIGLSAEAISILSDKFYSIKKYISELDPLMVMFLTSIGLIGSALTPILTLLGGTIATVLKSLGLLTTILGGGSLKAGMALIGAFAPALMAMGVVAKPTETGDDIEDAKRLGFRVNDKGSIVGDDNEPAPFLKSLLKANNKPTEQEIISESLHKMDLGKYIADGTIDLSQVQMPNLQYTTPESKLGYSNGVPPIGETATNNVYITHNVEGGKFEIKTDRPKEALEAAKNYENDFFKEQYEWSSFLSMNLKGR